MELYSFIEKMFNIDLTGSKITLNNCKNEFDPMQNAMALQNGELSDMDYSNTVAWIGQRDQQLFKVGTYIIQLIMPDERVRDRFMLASIAKVVSCVPNPNFIETKTNKYIAGKPENGTEVLEMKVPYEEGGNVPATRYTYKLERIDIGDWFGQSVLLKFKRSMAYQLDFGKYRTDIVLEPQSNNSIYKFPGFNKINHTFKEMQYLINLSEWKAALSNQKGIYMLIDMKTGKQYVGSAYGEHSLWQRWSCYLDTGHGGDKELIKLGKDYILNNFKMIILERCADDLSNSEIIRHESEWKEKFMSREFGYNAN